MLRVGGGGTDQHVTHVMGGKEFGLRGNLFFGRTCAKSHRHDRHHNTATPAKILTSLAVLP